MMADTEIANCFNQCFSNRYDVRLVGGATEPLYDPVALAGSPGAIVYYSHDYPRSALHEAAHWCIAGVHRRTLIDYGYRYQPPPRSEHAQQEFYRQEVGVQALEYIYCDAVSLEFRPSADNLRVAPSSFTAAIGRRRAELLASGLSGRARVFYHNLMSLRMCESAG